MRLPYFTSAHWCTDTTSPRRTRRFALTTLFMRIFGSSQVSSANTMHTVSFLFLPCRVFGKTNCQKLLKRQHTLAFILYMRTLCVTVSSVGGCGMHQGIADDDGLQTLISTVSPRNNCNFSIVSILRATTELSSFTASSTIRRFGAFFRSKIAVEKSFFAAGFL